MAPSMECAAFRDSPKPALISTSPAAQGTRRMKRKQTACAVSESNGAHRRPPQNDLHTKAGEHKAASDAGNRNRATAAKTMIHPASKNKKPASFIKIGLL
jgi:hypothetical protein